ncbi:hypothetical protein [Burkholderia stagnalis]
MNIVVEYPEDFPLTGVDRKIFDRQLRNEFLRPEGYAAHKLDQLLERIGLKSRYGANEYYELETLFALVRTDPGDDVRDALLERAGQYLSVRLRLAEYSPQGEGSAPTDAIDTRDVSPARSPRRWMLGALAACVLVGVAYIWHNAPTAAGVSRAASAPAVTDAPIASSAPDPGDAQIDLSWVSNKPGRDLDAIKRLMPVDGGDYVVTLKVAAVEVPSKPPGVGSRR